MVDFWGLQRKNGKKAKAKKLQGFNFGLNALKRINPKKIKRVKKLNGFNFGITNSSNPMFNFSIKSPKKMPRKDMNWGQAKARNPMLSPFGDVDKDRVKNWLDCKPFDRKRQGISHDDIRAKDEAIKRNVEIQNILDRSFKQVEKKREKKVWKEEQKRRKMTGKLNAKELLDYLKAQKKTDLLNQDIRREPIPVVASDAYKRRFVEKDKPTTFTDHHGEKLKIKKKEQDYIEDTYGDEVEDIPSYEVKEAIEEYREKEKPEKEDFDIDEKDDITLDLPDEKEETFDVEDKDDKTLDLPGEEE